MESRRSIQPSKAVHELTCESLGLVFPQFRVLNCFPWFQVKSNQEITPTPSFYSPNTTHTNSIYFDLIWLGAMGKIQIRLGLVSHEWFSQITPNDWDSWTALHRNSETLLIYVHHFEPCCVCSSKWWMYCISCWWHAHYGKGACGDDMYEGGKCWLLRDQGSGQSPSLLQIWNHSGQISPYHHSWHRVAIPPHGL